MKTNELTGAELDYWVARADPSSEEMRWEKRGPDWIGFSRIGSSPEFACWIVTDAVALRDRAVLRDGYQSAIFYSPSKDWARGGPIIERDLIMLMPPSEVHYNGGPNHGWKRYDHWRATVSSRTRTLPPQNDTQVALGIRPVGRGSGETALIAAMRAYVASHFGDEVATPSQRADDTTKAKEQS